MPDGDFATKLLVRIALGAYLLGLFLRFGPKPSLVLARRFWLVGAIALIIHVLLAFHFTHQWNHAAAVADTARQTEEVTGFAFGGGLYVNHVFLLTWIADAFFWNLFPSRYESRSKLTELLMQGWLLFIWFNATAIFGKEWVQPIGWLMLPLVCWLLWRGIGRKGK
jgi:hypothetical protein